MGRVIVLGLLICVLTVKGCSLFEDEKQPGMPPKDNGSKISQDSAKAIYRQFFFWGTHNTYSGNLDGMKREGIKTQLESGCCFYEFDLFSYYTQTLLSKTWLENVDNFEVFDYSNKTYLLSYSKSDTLLKAYLITALNSTFVCETTKEFSGPGQISLETLSFDNELFVLLYRPDGNLTVYLFKDNSFTSIFTGDIGVTESKLSPFSYNGKAYLGVSNPVDSKYNIYKLIVSDTGFSVGDAVLQLSQVNPDEILAPFEQNNTMHIFRHNVNSVTSIKVETLITSGEKWLTEASISAYSDLLKGAISVSSKNGKLFINSYTTNGLDTGTQLVMDNGRPIRRSILSS